ncbi:MAG: uracil-DNA glycosylase [Candidatus Acidifodinimicrobium sp.]
MSKNIQEIYKKVIVCERCPRLVEYRRSIEHGWRKPITGFGDLNARLIIVGPAPSLYGGNRTGRVFTGDKSGDFLFKALYEAGFSSSVKSISAGDGLKLNDCYITDIVKCPPPDNKPLNTEIENCSEYINSELDLLNKKKVILTLGRTAFDGVKSYLSSKGIDTKEIKFKHKFNYKFGDLFLFCSFHPSPRNTNTHKLEYKDFVSLLLFIKANYLQD